MQKQRDGINTDEDETMSKNMMREKGQMKILFT